jgi:hypothetical protein
MRCLPPGPSGMTEVLRRHPGHQQCACRRAGLSVPNDASSRCSDATSYGRESH